jgi:Zn-dependent peptidase ImmA (M78 family)
MSESLLRAYEMTLRQNADCLTGKNKGSVNVLSVCEKLGVQVSRSLDVQRYKAQICRREGKPIILLSNNACRPNLTPWERFLVGHELGHFVLYTQHNARPLGENEYWKHERLCDAFACWLLLPAVALDEKLSNSLHDVVSLLGISCQLAAEKRVPWTAAAHAMSERVTGAAFFKIGDLLTPQLKVRFSSLPNKKGIHRRVHRDSPAGSALLAIRPGNPPAQIDANILRETIWADAQSWASVRVTDRELRVAALSPLGSRE